MHHFWKTSIQILVVALTGLGATIAYRTGTAQTMLRSTHPLKIASVNQHSQAGDTSYILLDQGQQRTYSLHTPPSYQPGQPMPLVLAFHGSGQQGKEMAAQTGLNQLADQQGFLVVYPNGLRQKWNVSGMEAEDNVAFVPALINHLKQRRTIDAQRIYAVGLSNGGFLVQKLACQQPNEIAAFATVAASLPIQFQTQCQSRTPIALLMINGTADPIVPWQGGAPPQVHVGRNLSIPPIPQVADFWQHHNLCSARPTMKQPSDRLEIFSYQNCQQASEVTLIALKGAGHIWPGGAQGQSPYLNATQTVWDFFQRHSLTMAARQ
jgi:polyhydroxybutyrate depolymerase